MSNKGTARFTHLPLRVQDLDRASADTADHSFEIVKRIALDTLEYIRFTLNMSVRRGYIDAYEGGNPSGGPFQCILLYPVGFENEGILVVPDEDCTVAYAAHAAHV